MATEIGKARVKVEFDQSSIDQGLGQAEGGILGRLGGIGKLGGVALAGGLAVGVGMAGKALYGIGETFNDVERTIRIGTGATGEALDGLVDSAKNVGRNVPAEFEQIAPVIADLNTRLGLSGETLETVASQYLEAGRMLGTEIDIASTSAAFSAFKIEGEGVVGAMDSLFQVSQATGVGINELAAAAQTNGAAMQGLGFSFDETISLVGSLDKAGLNSTQTLGAMSKGLVTLARDGEEPAEAFQRVTGEIGDLIESGDKAAAIDLAAGIFGTRGAVQFVEAVEGGTLALDDLVGATGATSDTILGVAEETQTFAEKWQVVKNNAQLALEPLGTAVFDALGNALDAVMPHLEGFGAWLGDNIWVIGAIAGVIGVTLVAAFVAWTASIWASTFALLANPVTWIILAIVALIAALVLLIMNWDSVVAFLKDVWSGIVDWLAGVWDSISAGVEAAWTAVADFFSGLWASIKGAVETAWNGIADFFTGLWSSIKSAVETAWNAVVDFFKQIPGRILDFFLNWTLPGLLVKHWDSIKSTATNVWNAIVDFVKGIPGRFVSGLAAIGTTVVSAVRDSVTRIKDAAQDRFNSLLDFVKDFPARIIRGLGNLGRLLYDSGRAIIRGLAEGITSAVKLATDAIGGVVKKVRDFLPFSPAKTGPFSGRGYSLYSGQALAEDFARGMLLNEDKLTNASDRLMRAASFSPGRVRVPVPSSAASFTSDEVAGARVVQYITQNYPQAEPQPITTNRNLQLAGAMMGG